MNKMTKMYLNRKGTSAITINGAGVYAVADLMIGSDIIEDLDGLAEEQELVGVHSAKVIIRVSSSDAAHATSFLCVPFQYLSDGTITNYLPGAVSDLGQVENLIEGFQTTGNISWKLLDKPKVSSPVHATQSTGVTYVHQVTFVIDAKKFISEVAKFADRKSVV